MPENALNLAGFNEDTAENILVHGSDVRLVKTLGDAKPAEDSHGDTIYCDAIVSNAPQVLAGVKTADCAPILIGDPKTGSFAAVHAGWRGTLAEVATKALSRMADEYKTRAEDVRVAIGPAAGSCCYEVGTEVIGAFREHFPEQDQLFSETREDHACIDLLQASRNQLISVGVASDRINIATLCTMCRTDLFFSYRREKNRYGKVGRLMSVIGRKGKKGNG